MIYECEQCHHEVGTIEEIIQHMEIVHNLSVEKQKREGKYDPCNPILLWRARYGRMKL